MKVNRKELLEKYKNARTEMDQYIALYPGCKFVGFWRRYRDYKYYINSKDEYWREHQKEELLCAMKDDLPWPEDLICEGQDPAILELVAKYLDNGEIKTHYMGFSSCRICKEDLGTADMSDGTYVWPEKLSHYLRAHKILLDRDFLTHVLEMAMKGILTKGNK